LRRVVAPQTLAAQRLSFFSEQGAALKYLSWFLSLFAGLLVVALVLLTAAAVVARYVFAAPIQFTEEVSGILMIWIVFLGAICCEVEDEHLTIDLVVNQFSARIQLWTTLLVGLVTVGLLAVMGWLAWLLAHSAALKTTQILRISWFWLDLAVVVGAAGMALAILVRLWRILRHRDELPGKHASSSHDIL
jgi:TRAP-type C4-dicarboxylate transport system permease small subunit